MARNGGSASIASPWTSESGQASQLADALRHCRLTVLCGEPDDARVGLIVTGLLPLLRRRAGDVAMLAPRDSSSVILPFPERRSQARARLAELVVFNDALDDATPAGVHRAIDDALRLAGVVPERDTADLAERVRALGDRHGTRMLFVLDRFEVVLDRRVPHTVSNVLLDQLALLLSRRLPANVLISMRSQPSLLLEELRTRGVTMDGELFELPGPGEDEQKDEDRPGARDETYADIVTFVQRSRERGDAAAGEAAGFDDRLDEPQSDDSKPQRPSAEVVALANELASVLPRGQSGAVAQAVPVARAHAPPPRDAHWPWAFAAAAVLAGTAVIVGLHGRLLPADSRVELSAPFSPAAALPAERPLSPSASRSAPPLEIAVESEGGEMPAPLAELVNAVSNAAVKAAPVTTLAPVSSPAPASIVRYDALQATALRGGSMPISVIAPLYTEELYVVARADSSLRFIHQLQGKRINIGPANSARALTALELYERMFGRPLPQARRDSLDAASALQRLAASRPTFDAIVLPQPEPSSLWNSLAPETRSALRLLRLDPRHPASQRALQEFLPATLHEHLHETLQESAPSPAAATPVQTIPTLAAMTFLVANGTPDAAQREAIVSLARALCEALPALKRSGHPKWREVRAGQQFETPWLPETAAASAWSRCTDAGSLSPSSQPFPQPRGAR